jgi:hypothetical protein
MAKNNTKKTVILFIVEGESEEAALGTIMHEYFKQNSVQFQIFHGDITTKDYVDAERIINKINAVVTEVSRKYRYKKTDFYQIIHLVDTDGVYIPDEAVITIKQAGISYYSDRIETGNRSAILDRNHRKASNLRKLCQRGKVNGIPYRVYYLSCNLEHVLFQELKDFTNKEKEIRADQFADTYEGNVNQFIDFISNPEITIKGTYQETWKYIQKGHNSLQRLTNLDQLFREHHP